MESDKPQIIGVSGNSGAGKSTLTAALSQELKACRVSWDDFDDISQGPEDYVDWYKRGEDYTEWNYQALADVLQALKTGHSLSHPVLKTFLRPTPYIVFDAPLGRFHQQTGQFIDHWVHLHVPLDISLGRRLLRDFKESEKTKEELLEEIEFYLTHSRPLFFDQAFKKSADFISDGKMSSESQVEEIKAYLVKSKATQGFLSKQ